MDMDLSNVPTGRGFQPFPFGQCQVCEAEATGNHYGANTCEGCKGFFKRSLPVYRTFRCFFGNKCDVAPETRNRCKACRFRKCVDAGMALDAVKMGRIPKAVKEHAIIEKTVKLVKRSSSYHGAISRQSSGSSDVAVARNSQLSPGTGNGHGQNGSLSPTDMSPQNRPDESCSNFAMQGRISIQQHLPLSANYRFHPYADQQARNYQHDHQTRNNRYPNQPAGGYSSAFHTGPAKVYSGASATPGQTDNGQRGQFSGWQPSSRSQRELVNGDHDQTKANNMTSAGHSDEFSGSNNDYGYGGSSQGPYEVPRKVFKPDGKKRSYSEILPQHPRIKEMADMAITGDLNENEPGLPIPTPDQISAVMATSDTAVAVMDPKVRGGSHCMPVVPGDILVFHPSYVPPEKLPETSSSKMFSSHPKYRKMAVNYQESVSQFQIPAAPTMSYFNKVASNPELKAAMCKNTIRMISQKNNEIYGEETRANDMFLKEVLSTGNMPNQPERTPQQMRDILKERLTTQVKRVILLGDGIPGFRNLETHDQHSLLRTCIIDVWMVHSARFLRDKQSYIVFLESNTFYGRYWMEMFLTDEFLETVFEIATRINSLDLSFDELSLLKALLIARPDRANLHDVAFISVLHNHLLDSLKVAIRMRRPLESVQLLEDLLELLKDWRILDVMQEKYVHPIDLSHFSKASSEPKDDAGASCSSSQEESDPTTADLPSAIQA